MKYRLLKEKICGMAWHVYSEKDASVVRCVGFADVRIPQYIEVLPDIVEEFKPTGQIGLDESDDQIEEPYKEEFYFQHDKRIIRMPSSLGGEWTTYDQPHVFSIHRSCVEPIE